MFYSPILFSLIADLNITQYHDCIIDMDYLNSKDKIIVLCTNTWGDKLTSFLKMLQNHL